MRAYIFAPNVIEVDIGASTAFFTEAVAAKLIAVDSVAVALLFVVAIAARAAAELALVSVAELCAVAVAPRLIAVDRPACALLFARAMAASDIAVESAPVAYPTTEAEAVNAAGIAP